MKQQLGILLQLAVLGALPALIVFQLMFGIQLIVMPVCLIIGIIIFAVGAKLREA